LIISIAFTFVVPWAVRRFQKYYYPVAREHVRLPQRDFTMLGDELPDSADVPRKINARSYTDDVARHPHSGRRKGLPRSGSGSRRRSGGGGEEKG